MKEHQERLILQNKIPLSKRKDRKRDRLTMPSISTDSVLCRFVFETDDLSTHFLQTWYIPFSLKDEPVLPSALTFSTESLGHTQIRSSFVFLKYCDNSDAIHVWFI